MKRFLLGLLALALSLSCLPLTACPAGPEKFTAYSFEYFDTVTSIVGYAADRAAFDGVANEALALLGEYHRLFDIYHTYDGLSNLSTVNRAGGEPVTVDRRIIDLLLYAKEMYTLTDGYMNVAMGSVLSIWHDCRTAGLASPEAATLPALSTLQAAAAHTDIDCLIIDRAASTVCLSDPEARLDVGALAKGWAVEAVARVLEARGITGYVLNVGGNVRTVGARADGSPFIVGIENPRDTGDAYLATLSLAGEALVTSGSYQRYYTVGGQDYHHIIDRDTLMPAEGYLSVSVLSPHSGQADALSTALFCMDLDTGLALIESLAGVEAMWVTADGGRRYSSGFSAYMTAA